VYRILTDRCDLRKSYRIHLEKHIPAGGGLGGGSSNAAAFLKLVNEDASLGLTYNDMAEILGGIGSDTVYFLHDAPCYAEGRGEVISAEAQLPPLPVLLVNPGLHIPTGEIFSDRNLKLTQGIDLSRMPLVVSVDRLLNMLENTMESVVFLKYPVMEMFKRSLLDFGASGALMSGSGSTLFGIFRTEKELEAACVRFSERHPDVRLFKSYIKGAT
jgi:4-diphosphocytidyl-2-C-methyl-D-erythritol kinase